MFIFKINVSELTYPAISTWGNACCFYTYRVQFLAEPVPPVAFQALDLSHPESIGVDWECKACHLSISQVDHHPEREGERTKQQYYCYR